MRDLSKGIASQFHVPFSCEEGFPLEANVRRGARAVHGVTEPSVKRFAIPIAAALGIIIACVTASVFVTYGVWYAISWDYLYSPPVVPGDPKDAAAYVLFGLELFIGLPLGGVAGLILAVVVFRWMVRTSSFQLARSG